MDEGLADLAVALVGVVSWLDENELSFDYYLSTSPF